MRALAWLLLPVAGLLAGYVLWGEPRYVPDPVVIVHREVIEAGEPPEVVRWRDRVTHHYIGPTQLAVAPGGAAEAVATFCKPVVVVDTVEVPARQVLVRSGVTRDGWWLQKDRVDLVGLVNDGTLQRLTYDVRPGWDFRASGDTMLVRYPRTAILRQILEVGIPVGLTLGLCAVR